MASVFRKHKTSWALITATGLLALTVVVLPSKLWLENRLKSALEAQGFTNVQLTLSGVGTTSSTLKDITLGGKPPLTLKNITLDYSFMDLLAGKMRGLTATGLALDARKDGDTWKITGLENWQSGAKKSTPFVLPVTAEDLNTLPLGNAQLTGSYVQIATDLWQLNLPLHLTWQKQPLPKLAYSATGLTFKSQAFDIATGDTKADVLLKADDKRWEGQWEIKDIKISGASLEVPVLNGNGQLSLQSDQAQIKGQFQDAEKTHKVVFDINYLFAAPDKSVLTIIDVVMPWNGGKLSAQNTEIPFGNKAPLNVTLKIDQVSADALMQQLTGRRASATGKISGTLPVTIEPDGNIFFHEGKLQADESGIIAMSPDVISGQNEQVALVRDVLKDFHYTLLSIQLNSGKDHRLELRMSLEGNNPQVQKGRPVKLNVNLNGDVLGFVQQNLLWLNDPKKIMERAKNANP